MPVNQRVAPWVLTGLNVAGLPFVVWGVIRYDPWITAFGLALHMAGKWWFIDRMALLYDQMSVSARESPPPAS